MELCYYKKISILLIISILLLAIRPIAVFAARTLWPSVMTLDNDLVNLDDYLPESATTSNSRKGFLFCGEPKEIFTLGAGNVAINVTLSGKGHTFFQFLSGLKKRGIKITMILVNDRAPVGVDLKNVPDELKDPYFYMIDFNAENGEWQKLNFDRIVDDYAEFVDNWVIGNEINSQLYNFYGAADIGEYTKVFCESFKICYNKIKEKNSEANVYISFDQGWDLPVYRSENVKTMGEANQYRYNAKEQIAIINKLLPKSVDWGVALHPYPAPIEDAYFWDDEYAGYSYSTGVVKDYPYMLTLKNFEIALIYLSEERFLNSKGKTRNVIVSEFALTSHTGEREQAAGLYYMWEKMEKYPQIQALLYNSQTDLNDGYNFGLTSDKKRKRLIWAVFRDMDRDEDDRAWCKDLLDEVLDENGYVDIDTVLFNKASLSEATK